MHFIKRGFKTVMVGILLVLSLAGCRNNSLTIKMSQMQTCLLLPDGTQVFIDMIARKFPDKPLTQKDILVATFPGPDHYDAALAGAFPGEKLLYTAGVIERNDTRIELIPSARNEGDPITEIEATNYLVLITSGDWRILYCGDLGQDHMTVDQLERIGRVDICFASLENVQWCNMTMANKKGYNLIRDINPRLVIPLRYKDRSLEYAQTLMPVYALVKTKKPVGINRSRLPEKTSLLVMDEMASTYKAAYGLTDW